MNEVFDMDMNDLLGEESEFIESLVLNLIHLGVDINAEDLAVILHEYEMTKMEFLKNYIMNLLEARGTSLSELEDGPLKVVISNSGLDFESVIPDEEEKNEKIDSDIVS
ncbi:MAG: hypothetical protein FWE07_03905 [Turicibacter sp.]|nr:hypothetical protein [Turicibacter sp.]